MYLCCIQAYTCTYIFTVHAHVSTYTVHTHVSALPRIIALQMIMWVKAIPSLSELWLYSIILSPLQRGNNKRFSA